MNKSKIILIGVIIVIILVAGFLVFYKKSPSASDTTNILFYGDGCPHCINVEKYITDNNIDQKFTFVRKEVFNNQDNAKVLVEKAKICNIPTTDGVGVPFLWLADAKTCLLGEFDIIDYFSKTLNITATTPNE